MISAPRPIRLDRLRTMTETRAHMDAILLLRVDAAKNMRRFYRLDVAPDLFGRWCLAVEWGRIGRSGRLRLMAYESAAEARDALARQRRVKEQRGYVAI